MRISKHIPDKIILPFDYEITVDVLCDDEFDAEIGPDMLACWDIDDKTITLRASRGLKKQRADLVHEMFHAVTDWSQYVCNSYKTEVRG